MRFFHLLLALISVLLRLALIASPILFLALESSKTGIKSGDIGNLLILGLVWTAVLAPLLFLREIRASVVGAPVGTTDPEASGTPEDGRHFDFMTPGTQEYIAGQYGLETDPTRTP